MSEWATPSFDLGNRLRTISGGIPNITTAYAYDGHGRRVRDDVGGVSKHSHYLQSGQLAMTGDARTTAVIEYIYLGGSLVATRERNTVTNVYTTKYHHTDALGSPIAVTDASKAVIQTSEFEPYGKVVNRAEVDGPSYTGHVQDASSGLSYMQQRYYDPMIGRFLSVDPVTANSGTGANFNRYWYANNNPYKFVDPDGRMICNRSRAGIAGCQDDPMGPQRPIPSGSCQRANACLDKNGREGQAKKKESESGDDSITTEATVTVVGIKPEKIDKPGYWSKAWSVFGDAMKATNSPIQEVSNLPAAKTLVVAGGVAAERRVPIVTPVVVRGGQLVLMYEVSAVLSSAAAALIVPIQDMQGEDAPLSFMVPPVNREPAPEESE